ncbi:MAG: galactokinase [Pseudomonadota bacterium]
MNRRDRLIARARQGYRLAFGQQGPEPRRFFAAPGRVNLIGEHVDYNDGLVLPCAINRETVVAISSGPEVGGQGFVEVVAIDMGQAREKIPLNEPIKRSENNWQNLVRGAVAFLQQRGHEVVPARLSIAGDIPIGAGLSSSASFTVAVTLALAQLSRIPLSPETLARIARDAEAEFLGTECGIMDQMASAAATIGSALLVDCRSLQHMPIPVDMDLAVVIADSGIRRQLAKSAFNERRRECEAAARHYSVASLRDLSPEALEAGREGLDPKLFKRARHVVSEIARVEPTAVALAKGNTAALAQVMRASHVSLRDDFEVTVPQVDSLVDTISAALAKEDGPLGGVRMTGAGFGGCVVAVVRKSAVDLVMNAVERTYNASADIPASADVYSMVGGAREITPR